MAPSKLLKKKINAAQKNHDITHLSLGQANNKEFRYLFNGLKHTQVKTIDFKESSLTAKEVQSLAIEMTTSQIENIDIPLGVIPEEPSKWANIISNACSKYSVETMDFSRNSITDEDIGSFVHALKYRRIQEVLFYKNDIGDKGARQLANALKYSQIQELDLSINNIGNDGLAGLANMLKDSQIKSFNLSENNIDAEGAFHLAEILKYSQIQKLDLSCNSIGDNGAAYLGCSLKDSQIKNFNLSKNHIGSEGIMHVAIGLKYSQIQILDLSSNNIGDEGASYLATALVGSQVQKLNVCYNNIGDKGVDYIAAALKFSQIQTLHLNNNIIGDEGAKLLLINLRNTHVTNISMDNIGIKHRIQAVLEKNKYNLIKMHDAFKLLVSKNAEDGLLVFQVYTARKRGKSININKYLSFIQGIHDMPGIVPYTVTKSSVVFDRHEIVKFVQNISIQFCEFLSKVLEVGNSEYVNLIKKCEDMHLDYIVKDLLLNRNACTIETSKVDALYPYVYVLLNRYKQPLYLDNQFFKCNKQEIIEYFQDHPKLKYARKAIALLENVNENKRRKKCKA